MAHFSLRPLVVTAVLFAGCGAAASQVSFVTASYPSSGNRFIARGDFNNDGKPDIITAGSAVSLLLNNGDGTFGAHRDFPLPGNAQGVTIADLNNDGNLDVVACAHSSPDAGKSIVSVLLGTGTGSFGARKDIQVSGSCSGVAVGDFNRDGKLDAAVGLQLWDSNDPNTPFVGNSLAVLPGDGLGNLRAAITTADAGASPTCDSAGCHSTPLTGIAVGDFDRDGILDLLLTQAGALVLEKGAGNGTFSAVTLSSGQFNTFAPAATDQNQDGRLEAVTTANAMNFPQDAELLMWSNTSTGWTPGMPITSNSPSQGYVYAGVMADIDSDGYKDAAAVVGVDPQGSGSPQSQLAWNLRNTYNPVSFTGQVNMLLDGIATFADLLSADFNRDGRPDFAAVDSAGTITVFINQSVRQGCAAFQALRTVSLCIAPTAQTNTFTSPVRISANPTDNRQITKMKIYVDGTQRFSTADDVLNVRLPMSVGSHQVTIKAYDKAGSFSTSHAIYVPSKACSTPSTNRTIHICQPTSSPTVATPVYVQATIADAILPSVRIYIDGVQQQYSTSTRSVSAGFNVPYGKHHLQVKATDSKGSFSSSVDFVAGTLPTDPTCSGAIDRTVTICSPLSGWEVVGAFRLFAAVTDSSTVTTVKVYVDDALYYTTTSPLVDTQLNPPSGQHAIRVEATDAAGTFASSISIMKMQ